MPFVYTLCLLYALYIHTLYIHDLYISIPFVYTLSDCTRLCAGFNTQVLEAFSEVITEQLATVEEAEMDILRGNIVLAVLGAAPGLAAESCEAAVADICGHVLTLKGAYAADANQTVLERMAAASIFTILVGKVVERASASTPLATIKALQGLAKLALYDTGTRQNYAVLDDATIESMIAAAAAEVCAQWTQRAAREPPLDRAPKRMRGDSDSVDHLIARRAVNIVEHVMQEESKRRNDFVQELQAGRNEFVQELQADASGCALHTFFCWLYWFKSTNTDAARTHARASSCSCSATSRHRPRCWRRSRERLCLAHLLLLALQVQKYKY